MENKSAGTLIVVLAIGALLGFGGGYYYMQDQVKTSFAQGMAYQQSITPQAVSTVAPKLDVTMADTTFDFSADVNGDGDVIANDNITTTITIENTGTTDLNGVVISLVDPYASVNGLDSTLMNKYTTVSIDVGAITGITLYKSAAYSTGYTLGTIPAGATVTIDTFSIGLKINAKGLLTHPDSLDCDVYVYVPGAPSIATDFTVLT